MAELVDAQDLKSCGWINRAGSIPAICTKKTSSSSQDILEVLFYKNTDSPKNFLIVVPLYCEKIHIVVWYCHYMIIICTYQYNIKIFRNFLHIFYWMKKFCINGRKKINKTNSVTAVGRIVKGGFFCFFFSNFIKKCLF